VAAPPHRAQGDARTDHEDREVTDCPDELALTRAISEGADPELDAHLAACTGCRAAWEDLAQAIELARRVPVRAVSADRREEMRTAILAKSGMLAPAAARPAAPRRWWIAPAAIAAAAAVIVIVGRPGGSPAEAHAHGTVHGRDGARFEVASTSPDEIVMLHDGVIDVEVTPLEPGERFRVVTADTEVEVRGTAFEVTAHLGHVLGVRVHHGLVEVRPVGGPIAMVGAGQAWTAPAARTAAVDPGPVGPPAPPPAPPAPPATPDLAPAPRVRIATPAEAPAVRAPIAVAPKPGPASVPAPAIAARVESAPAPTGRTPQAIAYDEAWTAMRAGEFTKAAARFARVGILDPDGPLSEDATYWYAVALARAKHPEAVAAFRELLDRYPSSAHAHEASAMLGWLLVDANQRTEALRRFRAAADDTNPQVRDSARAGLAALGQ
jgi:TolA-binding protein